MFWINNRIFKIIFVYTLWLNTASKFKEIFILIHFKLVLIWIWLMLLEKRIIIGALFRIQRFSCIFFIWFVIFFFYYFTLKAWSSGWIAFYCLVLIILDFHNFISINLFNSFRSFCILVAYKYPIFNIARPSFWYISVWLSL